MALSNSYFIKKAYTLKSNEVDVSQQKAELKTQDKGWIEMQRLGKKSKTIWLKLHFFSSFSKYK